jgi:hypothetical protein
MKIVYKWASPQQAVGYQFKATHGNNWKIEILLDIGVNDAPDHLNIKIIT